MGGGGAGPGEAGGGGALWCERGAQVLLTAVGAFAAFGLMAIAIGTDYWLYARAQVCNGTGNASLSSPGTPGTGLKRGLCLRINHFPEDLEYDHDSAEYLLRVVRASSIFPILSAVLLLLGGLCVAASRLQRARTSLVLGAGILFVAAGLSNIIGVIVYISSNAGEGSGGVLPSPRRDGDRRPSPYSYGWSFYFGGVSFILAEAIGVLAVNLYIERHRKAPPPPPAPPPAPPPRGAGSALSSQAPPPSLPRPRPPRRRSRSGSRSSGKSRDPSPPPPPLPHPAGDISMFTLSRGGGGGGGGGGGEQPHLPPAPPPPPPSAPPPATPAPLPPPPGTPGAPPPPSAFLGLGGGAETPGGGTGTLNRRTTPV